MSHSDDHVSALETQKRRRQESDSDSENDFRVVKKYKRKGAELRASLQQMSSDSEEDNDVKSVKKRQKLFQDKEGSSKKLDTLGSLIAENVNLGKKFSSAHKKNKNKVLKNQVEVSGYEDCDTEIIANEEDEDDTKKLGSKHLTERKKLQDRNCSSDDLVDCISCDDVTKKSSAKQETRRQSGNISDDENSIQSSPSKQSMQIHVKKSVDKPESSKRECMLKEQVTSSESQDETSDISKSALEAVKNEEKQQNRETKVKDGRDAAPDSDSIEEEPLKTATKKSVKQRDSPAASDRENNKEKQQTMEAKLRDGREVASDSDSMEEETLKTVVKKSFQQRDSFTGSDRENSKEEQQNAKTKVKREVASDSDSLEEETHKTVVKKSIKHRDSSTGSDRENSKQEQQNATTKVKGRREAAPDSDSMEEEPLKTVTKKSVKQKESSTGSDRENSKDKQQNAKTKLKDGREVASDSDSMEEETLKTVAKKSIKHRDISTGSDREKSKDKQQNAMTKLNGGREAAPDSDSMQEEPLKIVTKKSVKKRESSTGSGRENSKDKQQNSKTKMKDGREVAFDSDSMEEETLKTVAKKIVKQRGSSTDTDREKRQTIKANVNNGREAASDSDSLEEESLKTIAKKSAKHRVSSPDSRKEGRARKQQKAKTKIRDKVGKDSDSDEEKLSKTIPKKIIGKREGSAGEESCKKKQLRAKTTIKGGRQKRSDSDSEDEKPLNTISKNTIRQRDGLNNANRKNVKTKTNRRQGQFRDPDSEEEVSTEDSTAGKLRKVRRGSESSSDDSKLNKSKPKTQKEIRTYSSDSDDNGPLKRLEAKTEIKQTRRREKGKETSGKNADSDMEAGKSFKNSGQETHTNSDPSDMTVDQSVSQKESQKNHKKGKAEKTELIVSDSAEELDVSAGNRKSKTVKEESYGSASDVASDALTKMRVANAVKGMKGKQSTEDSTDSSDVDEHKSKKTSSETKTSYHCMSSTESEDSGAGTKTRKTEAIKKAPTKKKSHKSSGSSSDSSDSDEENSRKDKQEKGKKPVS
jgi:hypothetical protein